MERIEFAQNDIADCGDPFPLRLDVEQGTDRSLAESVTCGIADSQKLDGVTSLAYTVYYRKIGGLLARFQRPSTFSGIWFVPPVFVERTRSQCNPNVNSFAFREGDQRCNVNNTPIATREWDALVQGDELGQCRALCEENGAGCCQLYRLPNQSICSAYASSADVVRDGGWAQNTYNSSNFPMASVTCDPIVVDVAE